MGGDKHSKLILYSFVNVRNNIAACRKNQANKFSISSKVLITYQSGRPEGFQPKTSLSKRKNLLLIVNGLCYIVGGYSASIPTSCLE